MKILRRDQDIDSEVWEGFVREHPQGNIFQTPGLFKVFQADSQYEPGVAACVEGDRLLGLLTWVIRKEYAGPLGALTARAIVLGGPLVKNDDTVTARQLLAAYLEEVRGRAIYSEFRNLFDLGWAWAEFEKLGFEKEPHMNFLVDIRRTDDELLSRMSQSRRKMLRRVLKDGKLEVRQISDGQGLSDFYSLVEITYKKVKKPYPSFKHFSECTSALSENSACFLCYLGSTPVASRFVFCYKNQLYDWYAGSDPEYNNLSPNEYIVWEIMRWGRSRGYEVFDFGGGGNPNEPYGPREFKRRFGGDEVYFDRYFAVHKPLLMKVGNLGFKLMQKLSF